MRSLPVRGVRCFAVITVALQVAAGAAAHAQTTVGGHIGIGGLQPLPNTGLVLPISD